MLITLVIGTVDLEERKYYSAKWAQPGIAINYYCARSGVGNDHLEIQPLGQTAWVYIPFTGLTILSSNST